jgi:transcriptional regulator with XRE-family HTH domain
MATLGAKITALRDIKGLNQDSLARLSEIPRPNLSNIERGRRDITVGTLLKIADALDVTAAQLVSAEPLIALPWQNRFFLEKAANCVVGRGSFKQNDYQTFILEARSLITNLLTVHDLKLPFQKTSPETIYAKYGKDAIHAVLRKASESLA